MKKALIFAFLALPLLSKAEPPTTGYISHTISLEDRLPGYAHGFRIVIVAPDNHDEKFYCIVADTVKTELMTRIAVSDDKVYMFGDVYRNFKPTFKALSK